MNTVDVKDSGSSPSILEQLGKALASERRSLLTDFISKQLSDFLGLAPGEPIAPNQSLIDLGIDSLRAIDFKILLESEIGCSLRTSLLFDYPTLQTLVAYLADEILVLTTPETTTPVTGKANAPAISQADFDALPAEELRELLRETSSKLLALEQAKTEPIAIVGIGCRYPGGATSPQKFWELQANGIDSIMEVPADRWDVDAFYDPDPAAPGKISSRYGGFLEHVDMFDAQFFGISPREAVDLDPQQRLLMEVTWETLENANQSPERLFGSATGVFIGTRGSEYFTSQADGLPEQISAYNGTGNAASTVAGRLSYILGLVGPSIAMDTACSSSLVAVHLACESLRRCECDSALAGGVNLLLSPLASITTSKADMLAPDGRCKTFSAAADGYVRADGCGVVLLKRLSDALADGDQILATILGSAINQDGASGGLTVPNGPSQEALIRRALKNAGVNSEEVSYIEAHGTGTSLGDPIEVGALGAVFSPGRPADEPLLIGSVKTNLGHSEPAAGIAGLIKIVLALQNEALPPHLHFDDPNPYIPWGEFPLAVPKKKTPWPRGQKRRVAGVSSFGFSGTNAHVVLTEAPPQLKEETTSELERPLHLLCFSAKTEQGLMELAERYVNFLKNAETEELQDICFSAHTGRSHFKNRVAVVGTDKGEIGKKLAEFISGKNLGEVLAGEAATRPPKMAFLFTGQGSQYAGMGKELYESQPRFRQALDACDKILRLHMEKPLLSVLWGEDSGLLSETMYTQPALFALEYALTELWRSWGVEPEYVLGHSVGEYAAACFAGVMSLADGLRLIAARGRLMTQLTERGDMVAVFATAEQVQQFVDGQRSDVSLAADNGTTSVVLSGEATAVQSVVNCLQDRGMRTQQLDVSHAFHSPLMEPMLAEFAKVARQISYAMPKIPVVSNVTGNLAGDELTDPDYWVRHVRAMVHFRRGMETLTQQGCQVFLEVGPKPTLLGMGRQCGTNEDAAWLPSLRQGESDWRQLLHSLGELYVRGVPVDWSGFDRDYSRRKVLLPNYPFQKQRYWLEKMGAPTSDNRPAARQTHASHALLGTRLHSVRLKEKEFQFESYLAENSPTFLADHRIYGTAIVPGAAFLEIGLAAGAFVLKSSEVSLKDVAIQKALELPEKEGVTVQTLIFPAEDAFAFEIHSLQTKAEHDESEWVLHVSGKMQVTPSESAKDGVPDGELSRLRQQFTEELVVEDFYRGYRDIGLEYGPSFRVVEQLWRRDGESLAQIQLPEGMISGAGQFRMHPVMLDACFQAAGTSLTEDDRSITYLPIGVERLHVFRQLSARGWCHARMRPVEHPEQRNRTLDIRLFDLNGELIAVVAGLQLTQARREALMRNNEALNDWLYTVTWQTRPRLIEQKDLANSHGSAQQPGSWLILADQGGVGQKLAFLLEQRGERCVQVLASELDLSAPADFKRLLAEKFGANTPACRGVVHLWSLDEATTVDADGISEEQQLLNCGSALHLVQALLEAGWSQLPRFWLLTRNAQPVGDSTSEMDAQQAPLWGFGAVVALEHPELHCVRIDLDPAAEMDQARSLFDELWSPEKEEQIAFRGSARYVARLTRVNALTQEGVSLKLPENEPFELRVSDYGVLENLTLVPLQHRTPGAGEVKIAVRASALNFKDVLHALGLLKEFSEQAGMMQASDQPFGFECAGRVVAIGDGVKGLEVGDEVLVSAAGSMSSFVTVNAEFVTKKPAGLSFEEAAALQTVFLTSIYGLHRLAQIKSGDRILIHAGAGGVGLAAIQLAQRAGAEVFATASPGKWEYLKSQGVKHVMNSRSLDFADEVMAITDGLGVDVVLNSLAGEYIPASLGVVALGGRFVEIGKIGIWDADQIADLRPDVSYFAFDLGDVLTENMGLYQSLLAEMQEGFADGSLKALPIKVFPIQKAVGAFRYLAQAQNIGKVVISVPPVGAQDAVDEKQTVRNDRSYLITGGLGALGLKAAQWMYREGARHFVLIGRSGASDAAQKIIRQLEQGGARVHVLAKDVSVREDVAEILETIAATLPPLGGIIHAAGVLDDGVLLRQDWGRFRRVMAPKVDGTWHLHQLTQDLPLDFFVCFSSATSLMGAPGQANYAAANAFMDSLAHQRRGRGLKGLSIDWGPWAESGMAANVASRNQVRFAEIGLSSITAEQGFEIAGRLLRQEQAQVGVLSVNWSKYLQQFPVGGQPMFLEEFFTASGTAMPERSEVLEQLERAPSDKRKMILTAFVRAQLAKVLGFSTADQITPRARLFDLGVDSLMAVDLKNRLEKSLDCSLHATLLFDYPTLETLVDYLLADVLSITDAEPAQETVKAAAGETQANELSAALAGLAEMSDDELARALAEEMDSIMGSESA